MFRMKTGIPVPYNEQGYIYFVSRMYNALPVAEQEKICRLCRECGGAYSDAVFEFVTTDQGITNISRKYFVGESTLRRKVRKYYIGFSEQI